MKNSGDTFRVDKSLSGNFTMVLNDNIRDPNISAKAKILHILMLSFPDGWDYNLEHLGQFLAEGRDAIRNAMNELIDNGFVIRNKMHDDKGQFAGWHYQVYELPQGLLVSPAPENPPVVPPPGNPSPATPTPQPENPFLINTEDLILRPSTSGTRTATASPGKKSSGKPNLPEVPDRHSWPKDVDEIARAFTRAFKRGPYPFEKSNWIKIFRTAYLPAGITADEVAGMFAAIEKDNQHERKKLTLKGPQSILFALDKVRTPAAAKPIPIGVTPDGGRLMRNGRGEVYTVYGAD